MNKQLIDAVRNYYNLPQETNDSEINARLSGSYGAAVCQLKLDLAGLGRTVAAEFTWLRNLLEKIF